MPPVLPINLVEITAVVLGCLMLLIPIAGLTVRFAVKPIAEALGRGREGSSEREALQLLERRIALLEQEVHGVSELRGDLVRVLEELEFSRQLKKP